MAYYKKIFRHTLDKRNLTKNIVFLKLDTIYGFKNAESIQGLIHSENGNRCSIKCLNRNDVKVFTIGMRFVSIFKSLKSIYRHQIMKAVQIIRGESQQLLQLLDYPDPSPSDQQVKIAIKASGVNRADVAQRKGKYPPPPRVPENIPGLEVAGVVMECGKGVTKWKEGDQVCALLAGGGYAEQVVIEEGQCLPIPAQLSFAEAASLPEAIFTVWSNVFQRGALKKGEHILIHGGSSGIGITAIQLAKAFGAKVFVTVGSAEKAKACVELGADVAVNYKIENFEDMLLEQGVDVVLDMIGGSYLQRNISIMRPEGRIVYINAMNGNTPEINIADVMKKRLTITGSTLRAREYTFKKQLAKEILEQVWPLIDCGKFKPLVYKTFSFDEAMLAHELMESSEHIGKIVLVR